MKKPLAKANIDPFKIRQTEPARAAPDVVKAPEEIAKHVDAFREAATQAKHFEGQATPHKDAVYDFAKAEFARRAMAGKAGSFKILGEEEAVLFVIADNAKGLTEDEVTELAGELGKDGLVKTETLLKKNYTEIRFDPEVLETNYEAVIAALQALPPNVLGTLFKPTTMVAVKGAGEMLRAHAKDPAHYARLIELTKIVSYIKGG